MITVFISDLALHFCFWGPGVWARVFYSSRGWGTQLGHWFCNSLLCLPDSFSSSPHNKRNIVQVSFSTLFVAAYLPSSTLIKLQKFSIGLRSRISAGISRSLLLTSSRVAARSAGQFWYLTHPLTPVFSSGLCSFLNAAGKSDFKITANLALLILTKYSFRETTPFPYDFVSMNLPF